MKTFYICERNGVTALVTEDVFDRTINWRDMALRAGDASISYPVPYPRPIFVFSDLLGLAQVVTGDMRVFAEFTDGCELKSADFKVPFSECSGDVRVPSHDSLLTEIETLPTMREVLETFGLIRPRERQVSESKDRRIPVSSV